MVVSTIILILAAAIMPLARVTSTRQREMELRRDLREIRTAIDKYTLWALNHVAVANISQFGGRFRGADLRWQSPATAFQASPRTDGPFHFDNP